MVALQEIKAEALGFRDLLRYPGFAIPPLQRPYAWEEENVQDFIDDTKVLLEFLQDHRDQEIGEHLFGTVVTIGQASLEQQIVDGQQRLTTVTVALGVLMEAYGRLLKKPNLVPQVKADCELAQRELQKILFRADGKTPRLSPSPTVKKTYEEIINGGTGLVAGERLPPADRLRQARVLILTDLIENEDLIARSAKKYPGGAAQSGGALIVEPLIEYWFYNDLQTVLLDRLKLVHVRTTSADASYDLFESLNTRGAKLNVLDLVKVWMLARFAGSMHEAKLSSDWETLGVVDETLQIEYLEDFYKARVYKTPVKTDRRGVDSPLEFSRSIRKGLFKEGAIGGPTTAEQLNQLVLDEVELMAEWRQAWSDLKTFESSKTPRHPFGATSSTDESTNSHEALLKVLLGSFKNTVAIPLLLQASHRLERREFDEVVGMLLRFFVRYRQFGDGTPESIAAIYGECCASINDSKKRSLDVIATRLDREALNRIPDGDFVYRMKGRKVRKPMAGHWLQMLEYFSPGGAKFQYDAGAVAVQVRVPTKADSEDTMRLLDSIGNFVLVPREFASRPGNTFAEIKALLRGRDQVDKFRLTKRALENSSWTESVIEARNAEIAKLALKTFKAKIS